MHRVCIFMGASLLGYTGRRREKAGTAAPVPPAWLPGAQPAWLQALRPPKMPQLQLTTPRLQPRAPAAARSFSGDGVPRAFLRVCSATCTSDSLRSNRREPSPERSSCDCMGKTLGFGALSPPDPPKKTWPRGSCHLSMPQVDSFQTPTGRR